MPVPATQFDSREHPVREQFDAWRERIAVVFDVAPLNREPHAGFAARAQAYHLGDIVLVRTRFEGQFFVREPRRGRFDSVDHYLVQSYCAGGYVGEIDDEDIRIDAGSVSILDMGRRVSTEATAAECLTLVVPRDVMHRVLPEAGLHGKVLSDAYSGLFSKYLASLERWLATVRPSLVPHIASATCDLMAACTSPTHERWERARYELEAVERRTLVRPPLGAVTENPLGHPQGGFDQWIRALPRLSGALPR